MKTRALIITVAWLSITAGGFYTGFKWGRISLVKDIVTQPAIAKATASEGVKCVSEPQLSPGDTTSYPDNGYIMAKLAFKTNIDPKEVPATEPQVESLKTVARNLIKHVDQSELIDLATSATFLKREDLERMQDPVGYIEKLFEVAIDPLASSTQGPEIGPLYFSKGITADNQPTYPQEAFEASNAAIYATFSTLTPNGSGKVIVRWFNNLENKMVAFNRYAIKAGEQNHYTWVQPHGGWQPGDYTVAIYDDDETLDLLATGNFYVVAAQ